MSSNSEYATRMSLGCAPKAFVFMGIGNNGSSEKFSAAVKERILVFGASENKIEYASN